jgi:hypothetical protein
VCRRAPNIFCGGGRLCLPMSGGKGHWELVWKDGGCLRTTPWPWNVLLVLSLSQRRWSSFFNLRAGVEHPPPPTQSQPDYKSRPGTDYPSDTKSPARLCWGLRSICFGIAGIGVGSYCRAGLEPTVSLPQGQPGPSLLSIGAPGWGPIPGLRPSCMFRVSF